MAVVVPLLQAKEFNNLEWVHTIFTTLVESIASLFLNFDRTNKGQSKRLTRNGLYQLIRGLGEKLNFKCRPHGLRHTSITEAVKLAQQNGYGIEEVLDFSRHANVSTLMIYRDKEHNTQGKVANLVANAVKGVTPEEKK